MSDSPGMTDKFDWSKGGFSPWQLTTIIPLILIVVGLVWWFNREPVLDGCRYEYLANYDNTVEPPNDEALLISSVNLACYYQGERILLHEVHSKNGWNDIWTKAPYSEYARYVNPQDIEIIIGCPEWIDGVEAIQIVYEAQRREYNLDGRG